MALENRETLSSFVAKKRAKLDLSTRELGEIVGLSHTYIAKIERDEVKSPSPQSLAKLAKGLHVRVETLDLLVRGLSIGDDQALDAEADEALDTALFSRIDRSPLKESDKNILKRTIKAMLREIRDENE